MGAYATRGAAPKTMTLDEQDALLRVTGEHRDGFRDHVLFSIALGTGLRVHEMAALNVGDFYDSKGRVKRRVQLRVFKRSNDDVNTQHVFVPDDLAHKMKKFARYKKAKGEAMEVGDALFVSSTGSRHGGKGGRMSDRSMRARFAHWLRRLGYKRNGEGRLPFSFHSLRHCCGANLARKTGDVRIVQRQLRHKSIESTMVYATPSDEEVFDAVRDLKS